MVYFFIQFNNWWCSKLVYLYTYRHVKDPFLTGFLIVKTKRYKTNGDIEILLSKRNKNIWKITVNLKISNLYTKCKKIARISKSYKLIEIYDKKVSGTLGYVSEHSAKWNLHNGTDWLLFKSEKLKKDFIILDFLLIIIQKKLSYCI